MSNDKLPVKIERLIVLLNRLTLETCVISDKISKEFEKEGMDIDIFLATSNYSVDEQTEALSWILNGECLTPEALQDSINEIEKIYNIHKRE